MNWIPVGYLPLAGTSSASINSRINSAASWALAGPSIASVDGLAINDRQLTVKLVSEIAFVADVDHRTHEIAVIFVSVSADDAVVPLITPDRSARAPLEFAAEMGRGPAKSRPRALAFFIAAALLVGHERSIQTDLQELRVNLFNHSQDVVMVVDQRFVILQSQSDARLMPA